MLSSKVFLKFKIKLTKFIRFLIFKYFHHHAWPVRLSSRKFDFDFFYPAGLLINLGAGPYFNHKNWIKVDFLEGYENRSDQMYLDLRTALDELPIKDVQAFYLSHTLEHFNRDDGRRLLTAIWKSLKPGGYLRIIVPDAGLILDRAREGNRDYFRPLFPYFKTVPEDQVTAIDSVLSLLCQPLCRFQHLEILRKEQNEFELTLLDKDNDTIINDLNNHRFEQNSSGSLHLTCYNSELLIQTLQEVGFSEVYRSAFMQSKFGPMRDSPTFDGTHPWLSLYVEAIK